MDSEAVRRADLVVTDSLEQSRLESGDLLFPVQEGVLAWEAVVKLGAVVAGKAAGRRSERDITLFNSLGLGLEDVAAAALAVRKARQQGVGTELPVLAGR